MFCTNCGAKNADGTKFCTSCGARLSAPDSVPPQQPTQSVEARPSQQAATGDDSPQSGSRSPKPRKKRSKARIVIPVVAVVVVAAVAVAAFLTNGFGLMGVPVRATVNEYSWDELSRISAQISACGSEEEALEVAKSYNLTNPDGTLDGTQVKQVELTDGTTTEVQIIGFYHDDKSDGSGKAGISFMFVDAIGQHPFNSNGSSKGGWESSDVRQWMNSELIEQLPDDLKTKVVTVNKLTNNVGHTADPASVTTTSDQLWLVSQIEIEGPSDGSNPDYFGALDAEGEQYQLFRDCGVARRTPQEILQKSSALSTGATPINWWQRSSAADVDGNVYCTHERGEGFSARNAGENMFIVPSFSI